MKKAYISSYCKEEKQFLHRTRNLPRLIETINSIYDPEMIVIVAQNWPKSRIDEISKLDRVKILEYDKPLGYDGALNTALEKFYNSDFDYGLFCDDDGYLYDRYNIKDLFDNIDKLDVDYLCGINGSLLGYKKPNLEKQEIVEEYFTFKALGVNKSFNQLFVLKNLKKYYNKEVYTSQNIDGKEVHGDLVLTARMTSTLKTRLLQCEQLVYNFSMADSILRSKDHKASVLRMRELVTNTKEYIQKYLPELAQSKKILKELYPAKLDKFKRSTKYTFTDADKEVTTRKPKVRI